jgi:hypothetical protein
MEVAMGSTASMLLIFAYLVSGCASSVPTPENAPAVERPPSPQPADPGASPDIVLQVPEVPQVFQEAKPLKPNLLGATYVKRRALPKVVASNWKVAMPIMLGKEGDMDIFVIEKKSKRRLVMASAEKRVLRNFYRYSIKSELELPNAGMNTSFARCASTNSLAADEFAVLDLTSGAEIVWLASLSKAKLSVTEKKQANHLCSFTQAGVEQKKSLVW